MPGEAFSSSSATPATSTARPATVRGRKGSGCCSTSAKSVDRTAALVAALAGSNDPPGEGRRLQQHVKEPSEARLPMVRRSSMSLRTIYLTHISHTLAKLILFPLERLLPHAFCGGEGGRGRPDEGAF